MKDTIECPVCHGIVNPDNPTTYHKHMSNEQIPTPRTDAAKADHIGFFSCATVTADFARQLERELHQWREVAEELAKASKDLTEAQECLGLARLVQEADDKDLAATILTPRDCFKMIQEARAELKTAFTAFQKLKEQEQGK